MTAGAGLVVVGTPIGNLGDLSPRARDALATADVIACEDTRRTGRLLQLAGLPKRPLIVANEHTEHGVAAAVVERIEAGERVALVSDAGMPTVSDPGREVVAAVADAGLSVEVVPGPSAAITALAVSGIDAGRFVFEGFVERKGSVRGRQLAEIAAQPRATVFYESPRRVVRTLRDLAEVCGTDRMVAVARELTKLHETVVRGPVGDVADVLDASVPKGEFVVVVSGAPTRSVELDDDKLLAMVEAELAGGRSRRDAIQAVADTTGVPRRRIYDLAH